MSDDADVTAPAPSDDHAAETVAPAQQTRTTGRVIGEWAIVLVLALLAAFIIRTFVFQTFYIPSGSMEPTLQVGDRIIVSKLSYDIHDPHRGDIIVFHAPAREATVCADPSIKDLVKRIIGMPGETISSKSRSVWVENLGGLVLGIGL